MAEFGFMRYNLLRNDFNCSFRTTPNPFLERRGQDVLPCLASCFQTIGADFRLFTVKPFVLQIQIKSSLGFNVGVASRSGT
jgi:hypothetical protein